MEKCILCGKEIDKIEKEDEDICWTCFFVLLGKYPDKRTLREAIEWHRRNHEELAE